MDATLPSDRPWIAYVGPFHFPEGGAAARRIFGNSQSLIAAGYNVVIASGQESEGESVDDATDAAQMKMLTPGLWLASLDERDAEHLPRPLRLPRYALMGRKTQGWLSSHASRPAAIILYSGYTPYLLHLTRWCRQNRIPLIFDAVEWYTAESWLRFLISPYLWNIELAMRILVKRVTGVIAISTYLASYYSRAGLEVAQIPPSLDVAALEPRLHTEQADRLRLAYCGSPGTKDRLNDIVDAVLSLGIDGDQLVLEIAGPTPEQVLALPALRVRSLSTLPGSLLVHGGVSHSRSLEIVRSADFTILLRNQDRVTKAGFPTKFVESLALGTPVICNITSDLDSYLIDGRNGLVCTGSDVEALRSTLLRALDLPQDKMKQQRLAARQLAEQAFDYRVHSETIAAFFQQVGAPAGEPRQSQM